MLCPPMTDLQNRIVKVVKESQVDRAVKQEVSVPKNYAEDAQGEIAQAPKFYIAADERGLRAILASSFRDANLQLIREHRDANRNKSLIAEAVQKHVNTMNLICGVIDIRCAQGVSAIADVLASEKVKELGVRYASADAEGKREIEADPSEDAQFLVSTIKAIEITNRFNEDQRAPAYPEARRNQPPPQRTFAQNALGPRMAESPAKKTRGPISTTD